MKQILIGKVGLTCPVDSETRIKKKQNKKN